MTGLGVGWTPNAEGFRTGARAFRPVTLFDVSGQRVRIAAEVDLPETLPDLKMPVREWQRMDRAARLLLMATQEAWAQSGWRRDPSQSLPIVLGTTSGGMSLGEAYYRQAIRQPHGHRGQPTRVLHYQAQQQALTAAEAFGVRGPITVIANACASGANAIGHGWECIRNGHANRVLAGGYDALSQLVFAGFDSLQALSPTQCRPFDAQRDGLALGEGAAVVCLEAWEEAERRGARVLGEVIGYGAATDGHHLTQPHPDGAAAFASMTEACHRAEVQTEQIGYVNAHGTGTLLNDSAEASAISRWAGPHANALAVSSTKASIGHLLGAAGAVEAVVCLMALEGQWLPPTATLRTPDPACGFEVVTKPRGARFDHALTNSFGFGGANATLILRRNS